MDTSPDTKQDGPIARSLEQTKEASRAPLDMLKKPFNWHILISIVLGFLVLLWLWRLATIQDAYERCIAEQFIFEVRSRDLANEDEALVVFEQHKNAVFSVDDLTGKQDEPRFTFPAAGFRDAALAAHEHCTTPTEQEEPTP